MPIVLDSLGRQSQDFSFGSHQAVAYTGTAGHSTPVALGTVAVRLAATTDCWVVIGPSANAASGGFLLPAGVVERVGIVDAGSRVSVRQASAAGSLSVTELT